MVKKRLTRKEIAQQDWAEIVLSGIYTWGSKNRYLLASGLVILLLTIAGSYWWQNREQQQAFQIQEKFAEALEIYHAPVGEIKKIDQNNAEPASRYRFLTDQDRLQKALEAFNNIPQNSSSPTIGMLARYYTGLLLRELNQIDEAKKILNLTIQESNQSEIRNMARETLADILQAENQLNPASDLLKKILEDPTTAFPKEMVLLRLARNKESTGNTDEALNFYRKLTTDYPSSSQASVARSRIQNLETSTQLVPQD